MQIFMMLSFSKELLSVLLFFIVCLQPITSMLFGGILNRPREHRMLFTSKKLKVYTDLTTSYLSKVLTFSQLQQFASDSANTIRSVPNRQNVIIPVCFKDSLLLVKTALAWKSGRSTSLFWVHSAGYVTLVRLYTVYNLRFPLPRKNYALILQNCSKN